jgi:glucose-1-phosphate thymidylyltransferase
MLSNSVKIVKETKHAVIFGYYVDDPERYGVAEIDSHGNVISLEEKPLDPKSNNAVVGLYYYPNSVVKIAREVKPSNRGELEITSINEAYLQRRELKMQFLSRGYAWLDTGTHESMSEATEFVKAVEKRTGLKIACIEEIAYKMQYIGIDKFKDLINKQGKSSYGTYLSKIV